MSTTHCIGMCEWCAWANETSAKSHNQLSCHYRHYDPFWFYLHSLSVSSPSLTVIHKHFPEQSCNGQRLLLISPPKYYPAKGNPFLVVPEMTWAVKWPQIAEWIACVSDCFLFFTVASTPEGLFLDLSNDLMYEAAGGEVMRYSLTYSTRWNIH